VNILTRLIAAAALNLPALAAGAVQAPSPAVPTATLTIEFANIEEPTGQILGVVFDSEEAFDRGGKPVRTIFVLVDAATETTMMDGLPAGRYAIKLFHDVDGDHKMGSNPYGMPTEPFAFSNNAVGSMGPAKWADAAFDLTASTTQRIKF
jgi:uncharacterized protein (DUF2141 family)